MSARVSCYCAFCKSPRKIYGRKHMGMMHVLGSSALTFTVIFLFSANELDYQVPILFAFFCLLSEVGVQLRWRMSIICPYCGFDPALYLRDAQLAVVKVKNHLAERETDPRTLLSRQPRLDLHKRKAPNQRPGQLLRAQQLSQIKRQNALKATARERDLTLE